MDVREKLVEIVERASVRTLPKNTCHTNIVMLVNALIEEGVTVQEFGGCEYCKEDSEGCRKMFGAFSITNPFHGKEWFINTGHCKPRQICFCPMCGRRLPQPPKGE